MSNLKIASLALAVFLAANGTAAAADWEFKLAPYLWFAGLEGTAATIPGLPPGEIDISPSKALEDTETALMLMFEARKGRSGLFTDLVYSDVRSDEELIPALGLSLRSETKSTLLTFAYEHRLLQEERGSLDLLAGARYWSIDSYLAFSGPLELNGRNKESWVDPVLGLKGYHLLGTSKFYVSGGAALGGFGVGSRMFYDLNFNLGYQWNDAIGTVVGYRWFDVERDESGFVYDVQQAGFGLGLAWSF
ncbi:MAG: hypothetical protein AMJ58_00165 [Gammaproteobacteria bacterium SG8_30]|jgi:hypothetical protein|nr:MAG: hypothetical protein AMJ58_00165 [Gammaproteobacteria bacterium SG8_30]